MLKYCDFIKNIKKSVLNDFYFNSLTPSNRDFVEDNFSDYSYILGDNKDIKDFMFILFLFHLSHDYSRKEFMNKIVEYVINNSINFSSYDICDIYTSVIKCGGHFSNNTDILIKVCENYIDLYLNNNEVENFHCLNIAYSKLFINYIKKEKYNEAKGLYLNSFSTGIKFIESINFSNALKEMDEHFV